MKDFKIKESKEIPLHYHLMQVLSNKDRSKKIMKMKYGPSDFHEGNIRFFSLKKPISHL